MGSKASSGCSAALSPALKRGGGDAASAVLLAATLLGEPVGFNQMIGIGCVLVAVLSSGWPRRPAFLVSAAAVRR
jgi:drug/metabolite transporter (DMT)-like permease